MILKICLPHSLLVFHEIHSLTPLFASLMIFCGPGSLGRLIYSFIWALNLGLYIDSFDYALYFVPIYGYAHSSFNIDDITPPSFR